MAYFVTLLYADCYEIVQQIAPNVVLNGLSKNRFYSQSDVVPVSYGGTISGVTIYGDNMSALSLKIIDLISLHDFWYACGFIEKSLPHSNENFIVKVWESWDGLELDRWHCHINKLWYATNPKHYQVFIDALESTEGSDVTLVPKFVDSIP